MSHAEQKTDCFACRGVFNFKAVFEGKIIHFIGQLEKN